MIHSADEGGYWAEVPALSGCFVQGETIEEVLGEAPALMRSYADALLEDGQEIPDERIIIAMVRVADRDAA